MREVCRDVQLTDYNHSVSVSCSLYQCGLKYFLSVSFNQNGQKVGEGLVALDQIGGLVHPMGGIENPQGADRGESLADLLRRVLDFKKNENGMWIPRVEPGDTVIVDKPQAPEIKVLDVQDQSFERLPKKAMEVKDQSKCTCPLRDILLGGCKCGGR